jgi:hypothetical protein
MIDKALEILKGGIQDYLVRLPDLNINNDDTVKLTHIAKPDGALAVPDESLGLTLVNIEEERIVKAQRAVSTSADRSRVAHINPDVKLNLYVLIVANFSTYETGLKYLSGAIRFFQSKNVFNQQNTAALDPSLEKLTVELMTLSFEQQNHLWGSLGGKYLPSVIYRVRMLTMQEAQAADEQPPIQVINIKNKSM